MRLHFHLRTMLMGVGLISIVLASGSALQRSSRFSRLAAYHLQASEILLEKAGGPICSQPLEGETFEGVADKIFARRGTEAYFAFKALNYHGDLLEKYHEAASRPWLLISADPPPPPSANPHFKADSHYLERVVDWDRDTANGFRRACR